MVRALTWPRGGGCFEVPGLPAACAILLLGFCGAFAPPAEAARSWTFSARGGVTRPTHDTYRMGGGVFDVSPTVEVGAARALGGPFSLLIAGTYITQREESGGAVGFAQWEASSDYYRTTLLPISVSLRAQRAAPDAGGLAAGLELGPALVWWRESQHVRLFTPWAPETHDAGYTLDAWVPGVRAALRVMTPAVVGRLALELGLGYLRTTAVPHPEQGFSSAEIAEDGLSLASLTLGIALRP